MNVHDKNNEPIAILELKSSDKKISNRDIIAQAFRYKNEKLEALVADSINKIGSLVYKLWGKGDRYN